jgi:ribonuclease BN (tRNA processing enzyme)
MNHPQKCLGYRIALGDRAVVYATDTERRDSALDPAVIALAQGAQLLIYDAQYTEAEYHGRTGRPRKGWGHSTIDDACRVASAANVERLALFHHDPSHDDRQIEQLTAAGRKLFANVFAAREGVCIEIPSTNETARISHLRSGAAPQEPRNLQL